MKIVQKIEDNENKKRIMTHRNDDKNIMTHKTTFKNHNTKQQKIKCIKHMQKKGAGRLKPPRPPLFGYVRDVFDFIFDFMFDYF